MRPYLLAALFSLVPLAALADGPGPLTCTGEMAANWRAEAPEMAAYEPHDASGVLVHLDPGSGRWFLQIAGGKALASGGGTFEVRREGLERWFDEWVGVDGDAMLRIWGGAHLPFRFVFLSADHALVIGTCVRPEEPFVFLRGDRP